jgi:hypothetical protein
MSLDVKTLKAKFVNGKSYNIDEIISLAYRDLQLRTIKGHTSAIQSSCIKYLKDQFEDLINRQPLNDDDFKTEHNKICNGFLKEINSHSSIDKQNYGKAQKVVNIIFKFLVAYGKWNNEDQCHMPVDSFVLRWLYGKDTYNGTSWSNISVEEYVQIQKDILDKIKNPISVGAKVNIAVRNRAEADYFVWYITKIEKNYKDTKNAIKKLADDIDKDDVECVKKEKVEQIIVELEKLKKKVQDLWYI